MKSRFQYVLVGVGITLLAIVAVLVIGFKPTQASDASNTAISTNSAEITQVQLPVNNLSINGIQEKDNVQLLAERNQLVERWVASIKARNTGWIHTKVVEDRQDEAASLNLNDSIVIPADYIMETWSQIDASEMIVAQVTIMWDLEGEMIQFAWLRDGISYNSFLNDARELEPTEFVWMSSIDVSQVDWATQEQTILEGREVIVIASSQSFPPIPLDDRDGAAISGTRTTETFDAITGQPLRTEVILLLADGTEQLLSVSSYLTYGTVPDLPKQVTELFNQKVDVEIQEVD
ncbi:hypothetical protein MNBD_CHLOROFLEXI01-1011 [hydrothermal vent metagenome]|uniref:Uncharacterized protein n=1 Tax=hydrothermal vent metagenome TaxID=652676 RepID=A0A3B0V3H4_9ZZZZ